MRFTPAILLLVPAFAQSLPDASTLLSRQGEELQRHRSYQFTQDTAMSMGMPGMPAISYSSVTQVVNPGKMRMDAKIPGLGTMVTVSDGQQTWMYMPTFNQYTHTVDSGDGLSAASMAGMAAATMPDSKEMEANAKVTGSEVLEVDGEQHDCWVIESRVDKLNVPQQAANVQDVVYTTWIDKRLGIQWKMSFSSKAAVAGMAAMQTSMTMTTHGLKFDEDLPDSLFVFTPPEGAKETKELFPGMAAVGGAAPAAAPAKQPTEVKPVPRGEQAAQAPAPNEPEAFVPYLNPTHEVEPAMPAEASAKKLRGMVEVLVTVDPSGVVIGAEALTGRDIFRGPAVDAVKQWTFHPVFRNGRGVTAYTEATVDFMADREKAEGGIGAVTSLDPAAAAGVLNDLGFNVADEMKAQQRIQELQAKFPRSPEQVLADTESQQLGETGPDRFFALSQMARQAFDAGDLVKAKAYATEVLEKIPQAKESLGGVNVTDTETYDANSVLGLVALKQGSVSQARQYLLESAKNPASSAIVPFGPDFTLARELLAKGERDAVIEFLTACKGFWKDGGAQLDNMIDSVRQGGTF